MRRTFILLVCFIVLSSHELFLKTSAYYLTPNENSELFVFEGTFDERSGSIPFKYIEKASVNGPSYEFTPTKDDYYEKDRSTYMKYKSGKTGTYVAGVSTKSVVGRSSAKDFLEYLKHEEFTHIIEDRKKKGISDKPAFERASKHVKAVLQVGDKRTDDYQKVLGYPIEFIPLSNPYDVHEGDELSFQLFLQGKPLPNQTVHFSSRSKSESHSGGEKSTVTNKDGKLTVKLEEAGQWYLAAVHMVESEDPNLDYESTWCTITFEIR
ncbi:MAG: DUF4198 domain-containing protein [Bacteroidota bacterium]